ncbi:hypothetical protein ANCDUO_15527 [Ancylostoma duodenale]|uniref:Serine-threonine/tyrosine-protein kinase catalytic domain-containing protein n=1 Tax=Ancylostoma duodenale TaxID=51022 RepID=A0A0C2CWT1_9BILA|nr:hypothetical protein ANCDUO_15527 [Ancylostoma duodenale]
MESDVWSFGLSLWELSIGRFPFKLPSDSLTVNSVLDFATDIQRIEGHPQEFCQLINGCQFNIICYELHFSLQHDVKQRWNMADLKESVYIKEAWPIDHCIIGEFVGKFLNT